MISNKVFLFIFLVFLTLACSSTKETTKQTSNNKPREVYVFDDVSDVSNTDTTISHEAVEVTVTQKVESNTPAEPVQTQPVVPIVQTEIVDGYTVQIGAFSTRDKAENFVESEKNNISYPLMIKYVEKTGLYAVQLSPFKTRKEAERVKKELWNNPKFSDAFLVHLSK